MCNHTSIHTRVHTHHTAFYSVERITGGPEDWFG